VVELFILFLNNLLPIFLVSSTGYLLGRYLKIEPRTISQIIFYVLSPCLVFTLLVESELDNADVVRMMSFAFALMLAVGMITYLIGRLLRLERQMMSAVLLSSVFMNAGNFGLPVNKFAFGDEALAFAGLYFVAMAIFMNSGGVIIASMGRSSLREALLGLIKLPTIYALALGILFVQMDWTLPLALTRSIGLLSDAAIPSMLILLGLQFHYARWKAHLPALTLTTLMRLVVAPALALGLSLLWGLEGPARQAGILEAGMPAAVMATILATEYDVEPPFVTSVVFVSTLLSPLTLTPLIAFLT
jgi:predicted permease